MRALASFDGHAAFATWMYRIATNTCFDHLRRMRRRPTTPFEEAAAASEVAGDHPLFDTSLADRMAIDEALASLPADFRVAVVLRDVGDLDYADIARTLGIPIGTVRSRIARGRAALAHQLGNRTDWPERPTSDHE